MGHGLSDPALTFAVALAAGVIAQAIAHHLRLPGIVVFLLAGVLLGPDVANVIRPETMGHGLEMLVGLAVAVILFEGGLNLNIDRLRREATTIRRLITVGAVVTAVGGALVSHLFMGWEWRLSVLFGTLVIVTGPTVITPLLRRIRVKKSVQTVLEAEGVLIDAVGAIIAVVALEVVVARSGTEAAQGLLGIPSRLLVGAVVGAVGGFFLGLLLRYERLVPDGIQNIFTLALVLVLFEVSNWVVAESGIMTVAVAGLIVGNMNTTVDRELREFKEQLTVMLVGLLFVLLAADVRIREVLDIGWRGVWTILALMLVVRPINVWICSAGSALTRPERMFISWLSPRGIVAAAVASLFAQRLTDEGFAGGTQLQALVFMVIAITVLVQGLSGGWVASRLGVRRPSHQGTVIVGANAVGRALARALTRANHEVLLVDSNAREARLAEEDGLTVLFANAMEERTLQRADVEGRRAIAAVTPNPDANLLIANQVREATRGPKTYVTLGRGKAGARARRIRRDGHDILFGREIEMGQWNHYLEQGTAEIETWRYRGPSEDDEVEVAVLSGLGHGPHLIPLTVVRGTRAELVDQETEVRVDDEVTFMVHHEADTDVENLLKVAGWERVDAPDPQPETTEGVGVGPA
ncbi:MAG: cation:proton antiporter [Gemmatimonadota bacterium]|nr:cation:proton antiporter [Gemmatimonadota bacterium]